ncbi:sulfatase-like hydrolase/transferase [Bengtsoniella intestinalis]|uniref:sulfatase-like hydrolase/transferase n=1 Tax=Bengtsoniella intestinalis TaxID=3073143 RepID=UPI00391F548E
MKKNLIFILADQFCFDLLDQVGDLQLTNLQQLRADSVSFDRCHTVNPVCSPSRASMLSATYPHTHGMVDCTHTVPQYRADYDASLDTFTRVLKNSGYHMGYFGKWHIERTYHLEDYGFDEYETEDTLVQQSRTVTKRITVNHETYEPLTLAAVYEKGAVTEEEYLMNRGISFIEQAPKDQPFGLFLSMYAPHDPYLCDEEMFATALAAKLPLPLNFNSPKEGRPNVYKRLREIWDVLSTEEIQEVIAIYHGFAKILDNQLGVLMTYLKEKGLYDDCTIVFTTDHGDAMGAHGCFNKSVMPIEESYHIPLLVKDSQLTPSRNQTLVQNMDIGPTVLDLLDLPSYSAPVDGVSLVPWAKGETDQPRSIMAEFHGLRYFYTQRIVWSEQYKYVFNAFDCDELYDLDADPYELKNLGQDPAYTPVVKQLCSKMWELAEKSNDFTLLQAQYFTHRFAPVGPKCVSTSATVTGKFIKTV